MRDGNDYPAIAIAGPTASGKSGLGLILAERFDGEIVNYDSVQLFRRLDIGSAKPSLEDRARVPHHLVDVLEPDETPSAGDYQRRARKALDEVRSRGRLPILVGGTGLYLRAVLEGLFEGPGRSDYWRERLASVASIHGREYLHRILTRLDGPTAGRIAPRDTSKVIRALEVRLETGRPLSTHFEERPRNALRGFRVAILGLAPPRDALYQRIDLRVQAMFAKGLVEEVEALLRVGFQPDASGFRAIGYRQVIAHIRRGISREEAVMSTQQETRRYAKRQSTWFRKQHKVTWFDGFGDDDKNEERIHRFVHNFLGGFPDGN
jgi:tRNA dimethylallyltransferase